jgi:hypothetical protein
MATVLLVLGVWILDVAWLIVSRTLAGRSPTKSGRDHLHQRLTDAGFSNRQITFTSMLLVSSLVYWGLQILVQWAKCGRCWRCLWLVRARFGMPCARGPHNVPTGMRDGGVRTGDPGARFYAK